MSLLSWSLSSASLAFTPIGAKPSYSTNLNPHLLSLTLTSTHSLLTHLYAHHPPSAGTLTLPAPTTILPREKPLPKPPAPTKWERFAKEKGISHKNRDKMVWDEEKQDWVARWGRGGKSREKEEQWIHEVKNRDGALIFVSQPIALHTFACVCLRQSEYLFPVAPTVPVHVERI